MKMVWILFLVSCLWGATASVTIGGEELSDQLKSLLGDIDRAVEIGKQNIWQQIEQDGPYWNFPPWLGTFFMSEYYFELKALNISKNFTYPTKFNPEFLKEKLLRQQEQDGSWMQLVDLNRKTGSLDATIFNYWFLKDIGVSIEEKSMKKAKRFILDHGGIQNAQVMTKYKLAMFGLYEWVLLPYIPLFLFRNQFPFYYFAYIKDYVAQWVYPHITALAYFRYHHTIFPVSRVCLKELRTSRSDYCEDHKIEQEIEKAFPQRPTDQSVKNLIHEIQQLKGERGSYGAYTISTILNLIAMKDYTLRYRNDTDSLIHQYFKKNLEPGIEFIEEMYFNRRVPYEGSLDDGRYWDTILAAFGLLEAGEDPQKLAPTIKYLIGAVQQNGGIPYGIQFQYAPDIDDTSMLLMLYGKMKAAFPEQYSKQIDKSFDWLKSTQNGDGGFPAFDKDKNDGQYPIIGSVFWATGIDKSAEIFDPSCPDIVGHLFEGMGECSIYDEKVINAAMKYLYQAQKDGMWSARWGINYVYAVGAVYPGLSRIGYDLNTPWIQKITKRLQQVQQKDGGFGEDSQSYNINKYLEGATTVSMTAWGLLSYIQASYSEVPNLQNGIIQATKYILQNFKENGNKFFDRSVVGTGHRGVLNLQYPVYAYSFPLAALSRLSKLIKGQWNPNINKELTAKINAKILPKQQQL